MIDLDTFVSYGNCYVIQSDMELFRFLQAAEDNEIDVSAIINFQTTPGMPRVVDLSSVFTDGGRLEVSYIVIT